MRLKSITLSLLFTSSVFAIPSSAAELNSDLAIHTVASNINDELLIGDSDSVVISDLEHVITSGKFDKSIKAEFGDGVLQIVRRAYAGRLFKPIWNEAGAANLNDSVKDLFTHGIVADEILRNDLDRLIKTRFESRSDKKRAKADVKLTLAYLRTAKAIGGGLKDEGGVDTPRTDGALRFNLTDGLIKSGQGYSSRELALLEPRVGQYDALKTALARYRDIRDRGGWLAIRNTDALKPGETGARIPVLRTRLAAEGYDVVNTFPTAAELKNPLTFYDDKLSYAVKLFQTRHGLEPDGVLGKNTVKALNESVESKIDRIADSMHRWRYQGDLGSRYIWANTPSFTAEGWNNGRREISMKTIVGKVRTSTPVFSDRVEYMVANPKWFVPVGITRRQKISKMRKDPGYAAKFNYEVFDRKTREKVDPFDVDWSEKGAARKYQFVQGPGEGNALGEMKIIFPNQYSVYLHGTPGKHLFDRAQRAFSSGCVRLRDPGKMAKWIAGGDEAVSRGDITQALDIDERERFVLDEQLPVHITYFTVTSNQDGSVNFWRDIYKRDDGISYVKRYAKPYVKPAETDA